MAKGEPIARRPIAKREPRPPADPQRRIAFRFGLSAGSRSVDRVEFTCLLAVY
jgi:hypothetical protein